MRSKLLFGVVSASCLGLMWLLAHLYRLLLEFSEQAGSVDPEYSWLFHLVLNLAGYGTIMGPGFLLYKYLQKINYFDKISSKPPTCLSRTLYACFGPYELLGEGVGGAGAGRGRDEVARGGAELAFCFTGLMGTYLVWGLLQEKIMTQSYVVADGRAVRFTDSTLLVLCNRLGALLAALARLGCTRRPLLAAPLYVFSYCALTNVLSAWCQYEALKYVSFPTQVLSKSCKVIPVMLMGKLISRNKYEMYEYVTAALISLGMVMFMFGSHEDYSPGTVGGLGGFVLLALYLCCDSFTSSWQGALFARYALHPLQMLAAVNLCSCALTAAALLPRPAHIAHDDDLQVLQHPGFLVDCAVLSLSSALGQLLIYRTIASFGAVVFAIIMTCRQAVSILLSCLVYGHAVSWSGRGGVALVLGGVLLRLYAAQCRRAAAARRATPATSA